MWVASAAAIAYSSARLRRDPDDRRAPLMGVLGAFLFAAQMINFTIPGTGSSGHLGGGLLLAVLLGPHAAFVTIASVLVVQALFFADGGLLALGCNIFNMGFIPAFLVYPLVYRKLLGAEPSRWRLNCAVLLSALIGLQLGPLAVVLETVLSGTAALPFRTFLLLMLPIHLAIGAAEGAITLMVLSFLRRARPELVTDGRDTAAGTSSLGTVLVGVLLAALLTGGALSWFASREPDGLEWAILRTTGSTELTAPGGALHQSLALLQKQSALLPDYRLKQPQAVAPQRGAETKEAAPRRAETSLAGIVGAVITLVLVFFCGFLLKRRKPGA